MKEKLPKKQTDVIFYKHDHSSCLKRIMGEVEKNCIKNKVKFTPLRKKVLEFLLRDHKPLGAYEILALLREEGFASTPPIAYRVLNFLMKQGFVHKIQGLNAFVACSHPGNQHSPAFMICRSCNKVAEIDRKEARLDLEITKSLEFSIETCVLELIGLCKSCNSLEPA